MTANALQCLFIFVFLVKKKANDRQPLRQHRPTDLRKWKDIGKEQTRVPSFSYFQSSLQRHVFQVRVLIFLTKVFSTNAIGVICLISWQTQICQSNDVSVPEHSGSAKALALSRWPRWILTGSYPGIIPWIIDKDSPSRVP